MPVHPIGVEVFQCAGGARGKLQLEKSINGIYPPGIMNVFTKLYGGKILTVLHKSLHFGDVKINMVKKTFFHPIARESWLLFMVFYKKTSEKKKSVIAQCSFVSRSKWNLLDYCSHEYF